MNCCTIQFGFGPDKSTSGFINKKTLNHILIFCIIMYYKLQEKTKEDLKCEI